MPNQCHAITARATRCSRDAPEESALCEQHLRMLDGGRTVADWPLLVSRVDEPASDEVELPPSTALEGTPCIAYASANRTCGAPSVASSGLPLCAVHEARLGNMRFIELATEQASGQEGGGSSLSPLWLLPLLAIIGIFLGILLIPGGGDDTEPEPVPVADAPTPDDVESQAVPASPPQPVAPEVTLEPYEPCKIAEQFVERRLRAPATADFGSGCFDPRRSYGVVLQDGDTYTIRVVVDAENAFSALLRAEYLVTVTYVEGLQLPWRLDELVQVR